MTTITTTIHWPQFIVVLLFCLDAFVKLALHGEQREYNFFASMLDNVILFWLLYAGGFFS